MSHLYDPLAYSRSHFRSRPFEDVDPGDDHSSDAEDDFDQPLDDEHAFVDSLDDGIPANSTLNVRSSQQAVRARGRPSAAPHRAHAPDSSALAPNTSSYPVLDSSSFPPLGSELNPNATQSLTDAQWPVLDPGLFSNNGLQNSATPQPLVLQPHTYNGYNGSVQAQSSPQSSLYPYQNTYEAHYEPNIQDSYSDLYPPPLNADMVQPINYNQVWPSLGSSPELQGNIDPILDPYGTSFVDSNAQLYYDPADPRFNSDFYPNVPNVPAVSHTDLTGQTMMPARDAEPRLPAGIIPSRVEQHFDFSNQQSNRASIVQQAHWLPQQPGHAVTAPAVGPGATSSTPSLSAYQSFASTAPAGFQLVETDLDPIDLQEEAQEGFRSARHTADYRQMQLVRGPNGVYAYTPAASPAGNAITMEQALRNTRTAQRHVATFQNRKGGGKPKAASGSAAKKRKMKAVVGEKRVSKEGSQRGATRTAQNGQLRYLDTRAAGTPIWRDASYHHSWRRELMFVPISTLDTCHMLIIPPVIWTV